MSEVIRKNKNYCFLPFEFLLLVYVGFSVSHNFIIWFSCFIALIIIIVLEPFLGRRMNKYLRKVRIKMPETFEESRRINGLMVIALGLGAIIRGII